MPQPAPAIPSPRRPGLDVGGALLLATLATALVALGSGLAARALPAWRPEPLAVACFLVAVEAALVQYRMRQGQHFDVGALRYLAAELFALAVLMRATASLSLAGPPLAASAMAWVRSPFAALDGPFLACLCAGVLAALAVRGGLRALAELEPLERWQLPAAAIDADSYSILTDISQRAALGRLSAGLAWGGVLAMLALVLQVVNLQQLGGPPRPLPALSGAAGIGYVVCATLLYSRGRLGLLRSRWQRDEAEVEPAVLGAWRRASAALVLAVALGALLLPRSYGLGLLDAGRSGAAILLNIVALLAIVLGMVSIGALSLLISIPLLLLFLLFGARRGEPLPPEPPAPPPTPPPPAAAPAEPPILPGLIFWACMAILAGYALWIVLRRQAWARAAWERLRAGALGRAWDALVAALRRGIAGAQAAGAELAAWLRPPPAPSRPPRPPRGRLGPRELIRYFYASALERAARRGIGRRGAATPYEYGAELRERIPEAADEIAGLTDAYVRAAYAPRPATSDEARAARTLWQRLVRALRRGP